MDRDLAYKLSQSPENVDKTLWLYELCRFLTQKANSIIVALFSDGPPCSSLTCPEMRASEWQYLCAVHDPPKSCCAIDYCCHTLDWAANTLTSPKHFPSRLALGTDQSTQHSQMRQLTNIFRRVYRIFAHAWFQHRDMFWKVEGRTGLYVFFKTVCDVYGLIPEDNYTIPAQAEGVEPPSETKSSIPPLILKREPDEPGQYDADTATTLGGLKDHSLSSATTKRHRHSPSLGATAVQTVVEENEEEEERPESQPVLATQNGGSTEEEQDSKSAITVAEEAEDDADSEANEHVALQEPSAGEETVESSQAQSTGDEPSPEAEPGEERVKTDADTETAETAEPATEAIKRDGSEADASTAPEDEPEPPPSDAPKLEEKASLATSDDTAEAEGES